MKRFTLIFICLVFSIFIVAAQDDSMSEWTPVSNDPLATHGESGSWNSTYNEPGDIVYYEGEYHLFTSGFPGFPAKSGIGYLKSSDGITYEWVSEDPVLTTDEVPYAKVAINTSSVIVEEDGTWVLYFTVFNSGNWPRIAGTIGRATAENPEGPWEVSETPVLEASGEEGAFDEAMVAYPSVLQTEDGYQMYFVGQDSRGFEQLGLATSEDGITWEKQPEPVFEPEGSINFMINQVVFDGEQYVLAYKSGRSTISMLMSDDGLTWDAENAVEVLSPGDVEGINGIGFLSLTVTEDSYYLSYEGNIGTKTQIYAITSPIE